MIAGQPALGVITARGGSKGLPGKNVRPLGGRPLLAWTVAAALSTPELDRVILSTDDAEIAQAGREAGCEVPFVRPAELARDDTPSIAVVLHALEQVPGYDWVVLLQPTSPLRTAGDISACVGRCVQSGAPAACTVSAVDKSPQWMFTLEAGGRMRRLLDQGEMVLRRQDLPPVFAPNGAVYVARTGWLREARAFITPETVAQVMPKERSWDIDTEFDLWVCDALLRRRGELASGAGSGPEREGRS